MSVVLPLVVYLLTLNSQGGQAVNIVAVQYSMIQNHSLSVVVNGTDTIFFRGSHYNVFAPGLAFLSLPLATIGIFVQGILGTTNSPVLMDEAFLSLAASLSGLLIYKICKFYTHNKISCLLTSLTFTLATSVWPFAVSIFPHDASLVFSLLGVYLVLAYAKQDPFFSKPARHLELAGLSLGIATLVEYAAGLLILPLFIYLLFQEKRGNKSGLDLAKFIGTFAPTGIALNLAYNYYLFGNPVMFPQQLYSDGLHFFANNQMLQHILFNLDSPYRGLLLVSPVLVLGIIGLYSMLYSHEMRADSLLFVSLFSIILVYYSSWQGWDGGWSYGPRFLVLGLPYLVIPLSLTISKLASNYQRFVFLFLFAISCFVQEVGAIAGSAPPTQGILQYQAASYALPAILQDNFAVWWNQGGLGGSPDVILLTTALIFLGIITAVSYILLREQDRMSVRPPAKEFETITIVSRAGGKRRAA